MRILFNADPQIGNKWQRDRKEGHLRVMHRLKPDAVCYPGDLTEDGADNYWIRRCFFPGRQNQWGAFWREWVAPFELQGVDVLLCPGNHDNWRYGCKKPVLEKIAAHHGRGLRYVQRYPAVRLRVLVCGVYPGDSKWIANRLHPDEHNVLVWHYPPAGPQSDWWSDEHKQAVLDVLQGYRVTVVTGHHHDSRSGDWDGVEYYVCGGDRILQLDVSDFGALTWSWVGPERHHDPVERAQEV